MTITAKRKPGKFLTPTEIERYFGWTTGQITEWSHEHMTDVVVTYALFGEAVYSDVMAKTMMRDRRGVETIWEDPSEQEVEMIRERVAEYLDRGYFVRHNDARYQWGASPITVGTAVGVPCSVCGGTGVHHVNYGQEDHVLCRNCHGKGIVWRN